MYRAFVSLFIVFSLASNLMALDLQVGTKRLKPYIDSQKQEYESKSGTLTYKPNPTSTIYGTSVYLGAQMDEWAYIYETSEWEYPSELTQTGATTATNITMTNKETKLGVNYVQERELAGYHLGLGFANYEESFTLEGVNYKFTTTTPYLRIGLDLIFGMLHVRADQTQMQAGEHNLKTNAIGIIFSF
ncbi:MAG: hypothetical protein QNL04_10680 [SAR324 cluster bacterium]|nr:hypothetical protein [SAR324 cluster bacterium]